MTPPTNNYHYYLKKNPATFLAGIIYEPNYLYPTPSASGIIYEPNYLYPTPSASGIIFFTL